MSYAPLTDDEWALVSDVLHFDIMARGQPPVDVRICADAVLHAMTIGVAVRALPENRGYPSITTLRRRKKKWRDSGALKTAVMILERSGRAFSQAPEVSEDVPARETLFKASATLLAMQACCRDRLAQGLRADWRLDA